MGKLILLKPGTYEKLSLIKHQTATLYNKDVSFDDSVNILIDVYEKETKQ
jgi:hypothetical protein